MRCRHAFQRAPRTGIVLSPGRCPEASREWVVTPPAGAAPAPPTAYLRMAAPRGRGGVRIGAGCEGGDKFFERPRLPELQRLGAGLAKTPPPSQPLSVASLELTGELLKSSWTIMSRSASSEYSLGDVASGIQPTAMVAPRFRQRESVSIIIEIANFEMLTFLR